MPTVWKVLKPGPKPPDVVYAFIEIPRGSNVKCEVDHETGIIFVDRVLMLSLPKKIEFLPS